MTRYSAQARARNSLKVIGFLPKLWVKDISKNFKNLLTLLKNLPQIDLKLLQKEQFRKQQKQLMI